MRKTLLRPEPSVKSVTPAKRIGRARRRSGALGAGGFTMIELMVTVSIMAILLALAAPSFRDFILNSRLTAQINDLVADISFARSEAAVRGASITMCASADLSTCVNAGNIWQTGRIVFVDTNSNGTREATEQILKRTDALGNSNALVASGFTRTERLSFKPYGGLLLSTGGSFKLCDPLLTTGRAVVVAATGRPVASKVPCP